MDTIPLEEVDQLKFVVNPIERTLCIFGKNTHRVKDEIKKAKGFEKIEFVRAPENRNDHVADVELKDQPNNLPHWKLTLKSTSDMDLQSLAKQLEEQLIPLIYERVIERRIVLNQRRAENMKEGRKRATAIRKQHAAARAENESMKDLIQARIEQLSAWSKDRFPEKQIVINHLKDQPQCSNCHHNMFKYWPEPHGYCDEEKWMKSNDFEYCPFCKLHLFNNWN